MACENIAQVPTIINCNRTSFLDTSEFQTNFLHCLGCFAIPVHIFGAYCILFKTPLSMSSVKWSLLNFHASSCFLDFLLSILTTPYLFIPALAWYSTGFFNYIGISLAVQAYIIMASLGLVIVSVILIFENRLRILLSRTNYWHYLRYPWLLMNYLIAVLYFLPTYLNIPDQECARKFIRAEYSCIPEYVKFDSLFFVATYVDFHLFVYTLMNQFFFAQVVVFAILTDRILKWQMIRNVSKSTIRMQRAFQRALIIQVAIPISIIFTPLVYAGFSSLYHFHYQYLNNISVIVVSSHGFFSTIAMLTIHRPYRIYTKNLINYQVFVRTGGSRSSGIS